MVDLIVKFWVEWVLGVIALGLSIAYARLAKKFKSVKAKNQAIENGVKGILRLDIIDTYDKCIEKGGTISISRKDAIVDIYRSYVALCQSQEEVDDTIKQLYDEIVHMPLTRKE